MTESLKVRKSSHVFEMDGNALYRVLAELWDIVRRMEASEMTLSLPDPDAIPDNRSDRVKVAEYLLDLDRNKPAHNKMFTHMQWLALADATEES
jgi:hypothetical protein